MCCVDDIILLLSCVCVAKNVAKTSFIWNFIFLFRFNWSAREWGIYWSNLNIIAKLKNVTNFSSKNDTCKYSPIIARQRDYDSNGCINGNFGYLQIIEESQRSQMVKSSIFSIEKKEILKLFLQASISGVKQKLRFLILVAYIIITIMALLYVALWVIYSTAVLMWCEASQIASFIS